MLSFPVPFPVCLPTYPSSTKLKLQPQVCKTYCFSTHSTVLLLRVAITSWLRTHILISCTLALLLLSFSGFADLVSIDFEILI